MPAKVEDYPNLRRVVTGHDETGRSVVLIDAPCIFHGDIAVGDWGIQDIWESGAVPVPIGAREPDPAEGPLHFRVPEHGMRVRVADFPPTTHAGAGVAPQRSMTIPCPLMRVPARP